MFTRLKRFRFHLSTALVLMLLAAGANWYYVKHYMFVPEPWETQIHKNMGEKLTLSIKEMDLVEAVRDAVNAPWMFSPKVSADKTRRSFKFENQTQEQILNQLCEKWDAKWTIQQGAVFVCKNDEEFPDWKSCTGDMNWSAETRSKFLRPITLCTMDMSLKDLSLSFEEAIEMRTVFKLDMSAKVKGMFVVQSMRFEHALNWACYFSDTEWRLRKGADGNDELYITPKAAVPLKADAK